MSPYSTCSNERIWDSARELAQQGCIIRPGYSVGGPEPRSFPPFISMRVAQWRMKTSWSQILALLPPYVARRAGALETSAGRAGYFLFSALLTSMGIKALVRNFLSTFKPLPNIIETKLIKTISSAHLSLYFSVWLCLLRRHSCAENRAKLMTSSKESIMFF